MEIAPRIRRIGTGLINVYLVEEAGSVTIIDAGAPGMWTDLSGELRQMGRSLDDVRAVVLTHGHTDHIGFAERIRSSQGVPIRVHELDAALARGEVKSGQGWGKIRVRSLLSFLLYGVRMGMLRIPPIREVVSYGDGATLDVPGSPRVIHVPGHSPGSAALHMAGMGALFIGDAIATRNVMTGETGPRIAPFTADRPAAIASLARLESIQAGLVLPGHGEPWTDGVAAALAAARALED
jgi:glyoxylase-like metal-dependent hydrolase (beta-lactamase superfamily II)